MKFGFRIPSINKRIAARTSPTRFVRHNLGLKAPRGTGWVTDPKKFINNKVYQKTSRGCMLSVLVWVMICGSVYSIFFAVFRQIKYTFY